MTKLLCCIESKTTKSTSTHIKKVSEAKYLGVTIKSNLEWDKHIDSTCAKASKLLGFLRRNIKIAPKVTKELGYKALVGPILDYCSCVWGPYTQKNIDKLEKFKEVLPALF